jgi:hypothetical protein
VCFSEPVPLSFARPGWMEIDPESEPVVEEWRAAHSTS